MPNIHEHNFKCSIWDVVQVAAYYQALTITSCTIEK